MQNRTIMGIELGSTRIKAVLMDRNHTVLAQGAHTWENQFENGIWTYSMEAVELGLQDAVARLLASAPESIVIDGIGISAMMHGYMPFDENMRLLTPFRTWRNTTTRKAAETLSALFDCNIPQRWSVTHLCHAVMHRETHVKDIRKLGALSVYVHQRLTGQFVVGIGEASGMFPLDGIEYDPKLIALFQKLISDYDVRWTIEELLPAIRIAGEDAGCLTEEGARWLDPSGRIQAGIPLAPPEGDAGTGMVATNSIAPRTGNVSAGTSVFSLTVLEKPLSKAYPEVDVVATPDGKPVALVQCCNCTPDSDAWVKMFARVSELFGRMPNVNELYTSLYQESLRGDPDCGGVTVVGYLAGEHIPGLDRGCPLVLRSAESKFSLANFMRAQLYTALATLCIGMRRLKEEGVAIDRLTAHGGYFKTPDVGQQYLADALNTPVALMETAGEGGAYGMALLAAYRVWKKEKETLDQYLTGQVFSHAEIRALEPNEKGVEGFADYLRRFEKAISVERTAVESMEIDSVTSQNEL